MSANYQAVLWNKQKKRYDFYLWLGILWFLGGYMGAQLVLHPDITIETVIIRGTALTAFVLLHFILAIGPLARLDNRFLPWLYNRRHAGVSMFLIALVHGVFSLMNFHALGDVNPLVSLFTSNQYYASISAFPFQVLGFFALLILALMAATSHDFWLKNLSPRIWKGLHMMVYLAYALIVLHVATGALQYESHPLNWLLLISGFVTIAGLHLYTGFKMVGAVKQQKQTLKAEGFYEVCHLDEIEMDYAKPFFVNGENIAVFKYDGKVSAIHNVCKHQMGPLGEGKVVDGCVTCPWHGYQYLPHNGQSPPPFTEKVKTYDVRIVDGMIWVNPKGHPEGTAVEPAKI